MEKVKKFVSEYLTHIRPPYTRGDLFAIIATLLVIFTPTTLVIATQKSQNTPNLNLNNQIVFINSQTLQVVQSITSPNVEVQLTAPWPVLARNQNHGQVAGENTIAQNITNDLPNPVVGKKKPNPTKAPTPVATSTPTEAPTQDLLSLIVLAENEQFTQNVVTISPVTSNPFITMYTFSDASVGTKTLYAKFVSNRGGSLIYSKSIQLVQPITTTSSPVPRIGGDVEPSPNDPPCLESAHTNSKFHTLWDPILKCHYDHEHGDDPFTNNVASAFPNLNLQTLLGGVQIGHTNPSGPMENTHKHGGFKWQVQVPAPQGCAIGFEGAGIGVDAVAMQYHAFGNYAIEMDSRIHSALALFRQCLPSNPTDYGYAYIVQHIDYGQRVSAYQGRVIPYADSPQPAYNSGLGPYFTIDCIGDSTPPCGRYNSRQEAYNANSNINSIWTSKSSFRVSPSGSPLFALLFRVRDVYQIFDFRDVNYPFTFHWMCSEDDGLTYSAKPGCRYNNSTTEVHEITGVIPQSWDNLSGFDTNPTVGRITANGYVTRFGNLNSQCTAIGVDCHPIKLINAFVGHYGAELSAEKVSNPTPLNTPERDIYFCNGRVCNETGPGAVSSGWIGQNN